MKFILKISSIDDKNFFQKEQILCFRVDEKEPIDKRKPFWEIINKERINNHYDWDEEILYREDFDSIQNLIDLQYVLNEMINDLSDFTEFVIHNQTGTIWEIYANHENEIIYTIRVLSVQKHIWQEFYLDKTQIIEFNDLLKKYISYFIK